jgi:hypothetical protein
LSGQLTAYNEARRQLVLFGGNLGSIDFSDETWAWDGQAWRRLMPALRPTPRSDRQRFVAELAG